MSNLKNKKKLSNIAAIFMLTFVIGGAFAFTPGQLDVTGTINLAEQDYVIWYSAVSPNPLGFAVGANQSSSIENARGRTDQSIVWNIDLNRIDPIDGVAMVAMTAVARNNSSQTIEITAVTPNVYEWTVIAEDALGTPFTAADFGLTINVPTAGAFFNPILPNANSATIEFEVVWDGTFPVDFVFDDNEDYTFVADFEITFDYAIV